MKSEDLRKSNETLIESWRNFWNVNVPFSVELGRTKLRVREIIELQADSIIKLPRSTGEGVDIFVHNQPLLRGEIVAIEDRSGVRVSEIVTEEN
jgi:flagellar motor switch protein FliN/FliY